MKVVILAGGLGSRLAEETSIRPKPMVEIGGIPIIEHIMNWYMGFGFNDFIICLGFSFKLPPRSNVIKMVIIMSASEELTVDDKEIANCRSKTVNKAEGYENR